GIETRTASANGPAWNGCSAVIRAIKYSSAEYTTSGSNVQTTWAESASLASSEGGGDARSAEKRASAMTTNRSLTPSPVGSRTIAGLLTGLRLSTSCACESLPVTKRTTFSAASTSFFTRVASRFGRTSTAGILSTTSAFRLFSSTTSSKYV